ncbi:MAG: tRNA pseudouridine(55) synthase TruB [Armatimonadetes bacterium]|nr:tRNA pseudouridine(55) synthase TruB [Armatimonadota bacterium]
MNEFGIILIDKPAGITSFDVVKNIRKITNIRKVGHTGTLDPFASGLLPVCIGKATRIADKLSSKDKEYIVTMKLGIKTNTGDKTGKIIEEKEIPEFKTNELKQIIPDILIISEQIPPKFSAVKINGKRAYELARKDEKISLKARPIKILNFEILKYKHPFISYKTKVSKGTYIRALSETFAEKLGEIATTWELRRTKIGKLDVHNSIKLEELTQENWKNYLHSIAYILPDFPRINLKKEEIESFQNGRFLTVTETNQNEIMVLDEEKKCIGFAEIQNNIFKPKMVLI